MERTPHFDLAVDRDLFVVRWHDAQVEALAPLSDRIRAQHAEFGQLFYVAIIGSEAEPPDEATRSEILASLAATYELLRSSNLVLLGTGLRATMVRGGLVAMTLVSGLRRQPIAVEKSIWTIAAKAEALTGRNPENLVSWIIREGLLSADEAGPAPA